MGIDPYSPVTVACLTVVTLEAVSGILMNLFILFVIQQKVHRVKSTYSGDAINAAMTRSNIFLTLVLIVSLFCYIFSTKVYKTLNILLTLLTTYSISSSLYLTAIFCFFLFIKVVQLKSGVLAWVKRNIPLVLPRLMVAVEVFSFCCSFLSFFFYGVNGEFYTNSSAVSTANVIKGNNLDRDISFQMFAVFLVPYLSMAMTTILAAGSLILQSHKIKIMKITGPPVNTETYRNAVYKMMRLFIYHTLFCSILFVAYFSGLADGGPWYWTALIIMFLLSPANSLIIIYSNTKLRNAWEMMIGYMVYCKSFDQAENT